MLVLVVVSVVLTATKCASSDSGSEPARTAVKRPGPAAGASQPQASWPPRGPGRPRAEQALRPTVTAGPFRVHRHERRPAASCLSDSASGSLRHVTVMVKDAPCAERPGLSAASGSAGSGCCAARTIMNSELVLVCCSAELAGDYFPFLQRVQKLQKEAENSGE